MIKGKNKGKASIGKNKKNKFGDNSLGYVPTTQEEYSFSHVSETDADIKHIEKDLISSKAKTAIVIMLLCLFSVIIATGWNYIAPDKLINNIQRSLSGKIGEDFPTLISGTNISSTNFQYNRGYLTYVSDTSLICLNKSAGKVVDRPISFSQPALKIAGDNMLIYNIDGTGYQVDTIGETKSKGELENAIIHGEISENGVYGFITKADGYLSKLSVFNPSNKEIFNYFFSDYYATSISMNKSGTRAAVSAVSSKDGEFKTAIYILDFSKEDPIAILEENETLVYACSFMDNGAIAAIGDTQAFMVKPNYTDVDRYNYEGLTLTSFSFDSSSGGVISLSSSGDGSNCHIVYLNKNGLLQNIKDTVYRIVHMDFNGGEIAALCDGGKTNFFGLDGGEIGSVISGPDARGIAMCDRSSIYVLGVSEIRVAYIN